MTSAIIETGGKQYRVQPGQLIKIEKLSATVGSTVTFDRVLAVMEDGTTELGHPTVATVVSAEVVEQGKGKKLRVFTFKSKKRQKRTLGHRQLVTTVLIGKIGAQPVKAEKPVKVAVKKTAPKKAVK